MLPKQPPRSAVAPLSWQARMNITEALAALEGRHHDDVPQRRAEIAALRRDCEELAQGVCEVRREWRTLVRSYIQKYNADEPRVPKGNPDGGQWTKASAVSGSSDNIVLAGQFNVTPHGFTIEDQPGGIR